MAKPIWNDNEKRWIISAQKNGERIRFTCNTPGRRGMLTVKKKYSDWLAGITPVVAPLLSEAWKAYAEDIRLRCATSTHINNSKYGEAYLLPHFGKRRTDQITEHDWQKILNAAKKKDGTPLSKKTVSNIKGIIINFCKFCRRAKWMDTVPEDLYLQRNLEKKGKPLVPPALMREVFDEKNNGVWYIHSWRFMALTGIRPGELRGIRDEDIVDGALHIRRAIDPHGNVTEGKSINARRVLVLPALAIKAIGDQLDMVGDRDRVSLFCSPTGIIPNATWYFRQWKTFCTERGFDVPLYSFRHTFVSITKNTIPEETLKLWVGHSDAMDTTETYGHEIPGEIKNASKIVDISMTRYLEIMQ